MDDYTKMTDDELRQAIAEAKGWQLDVTSKAAAVISSETHFLTRKLHIFPDWPTDIRAAWELVEEMLAYNMSIKLVDTGGSVPDKFMFFIRERGLGYSEWWSAAPTAPRAICLAWLAWKRACNSSEKA